MLEKKSKTFSTPETFLIELYNISIEATQHKRFRIFVQTNEMNMKE